MKYNDYIELQKDSLGQAGMFEGFTVFKDLDKVLQGFPL